MGKKSNIFLAVFGMFILVIIGSSLFSDDEPATSPQGTMTITSGITTETRSPEGVLISSKTTFDNAIPTILSTSDGITRYYITPYSYDPNFEPVKYRTMMDKAVRNSFNVWENFNSELKFVEVSDKSKSDITIFWNDKLKLEGENISGLAEITEIDGRHIALEGDIFIDTVDTDCNGRPIFRTQTVVEDTIKHEIGHVLGLDHSSKTTHLMYGDDAAGHFDSLGYVVPSTNSEFDSWLEFDELNEQHEDIIEKREEISQKRNELSSIINHNEATVNAYVGSDGFVPEDQYDMYLEEYENLEAYIATDTRYFDEDAKYFDEETRIVESIECFINNSD